MGGEERRRGENEALTLLRTLSGLGPDLASGGGGALAEGRKIYEMIGGRALFGWTVARNKSRGFRVSST